MNAIRRPAPLDREGERDFWRWRAEAGMTSLPAVVLRAAWDQGRAELLCSLLPLLQQGGSNDEALLARHGLDRTGLTRREAQITAVLLRYGMASERVVGYAEVAEYVLADQRLTEEIDRRTIASHLNRLRPKVAGAGICIGTVAKRGFHVHRAAEGWRCPAYRNRAEYLALCLRGGS